MNQQPNTIANMNTDIFKSRANSFVQIGDHEHIRYDEFVRKLFKQEDPRLMMYHAALGMCTEAGEAGDAVKKVAAYNKELDRKNLIEELGDLRFFMQAIMNQFGISEQEVLQHNACKLSTRYEGLQYSDAAAQARADKKDETPLPTIPVVLPSASVEGMDDMGNISHDSNKD